MKSTLQKWLAKLLKSSKRKPKTYDEMKSDIAKIRSRVIELEKRMDEAGW